MSCMSSMPFRPCNQVRVKVPKQVVTVTPQSARCFTQLLMLLHRSCDPSSINLLTKVIVFSQVIMFGACTVSQVQLRLQ